MLLRPSGKVPPILVTAMFAVAVTAAATASPDPNARGKAPTAEEQRVVAAAGRAPLIDLTPGAVPAEETLYPYRILAPAAGAGDGDAGGASPPPAWAVPLLLSGTALLVLTAVTLRLSATRRAVPARM